jgi:hypothetical protein
MHYIPCGEHAIIPANTLFHLPFLAYTLSHLPSPSYTLSHQTFPAYILSHLPFIAFALPAYQLPIFFSCLLLPSLFARQYYLTPSFYYLPFIPTLSRLAFPA